jgi:hypothetical protein
MIRYLTIASFLLVSLAQRNAAAQPGPAARQQGSVVPGVAVVLASIAAGAALTGYGLTIDCSETDHACHRRASLPIWGGVGLASVGTLCGLALLPARAADGSARLMLVGSFE